MLVEGKIEEQDLRHCRRASVVELVYLSRIWNTKYISIYATEFTIFQKHLEYSALLSDLLIEIILQHSLTLF
jgi:hypothetical protein